MMSYTSMGSVRFLAAAMVGDGSSGAMVMMPAFWVGMTPAKAAAPPALPVLDLGELAPAYDGFNPGDGPPPAPMDIGGGPPPSGGGGGADMLSSVFSRLQIGIQIVKCKYQCCMNLRKSTISQFVTNDSVLI